MPSVNRFVPAFATLALLGSSVAFSAPIASGAPAQSALSAPVSGPQAVAPAAQPAAAFTTPDADLLAGTVGSSASAFKAKHQAEYAVTEGRSADFYMGVVQGFPAFVVYTHDGDRITGREVMVSGARETMAGAFQAMSGDYATGAINERVIECRDVGSKSAGLRLESNTLSRSKAELLTYREDQTNHAVVLGVNSPAGAMSTELLNKAYTDLLARADLATNGFARQWLAYKAAYGDVSRSKGLSGCRMSTGGADGNLPLKFDVALTQTGAQVVNGVVDINVPEQMGGLNFSSFQAVLVAGKVSGLRYSGNIPQARFDEMLKKVVSSLGDPITLVMSSNGAETQTVATFRPKDQRTRRVQTVLSYRARSGQTAEGLVLFDIH